MKRIELELAIADSVDNGMIVRVFLNEDTEVTGYGMTLSEALYDLAENVAIEGDYR